METIWEVGWGGHTWPYVREPSIQWDLTVWSGGDESVKWQLVKVPWFGVVSIIAYYLTSL
jgi:hypothetical protein